MELDEFTDELFKGKYVSRLAFQFWSNKSTFYQDKYFITFRFN